MRHLPARAGIGEMRIRQFRPAQLCPERARQHGSGSRLDCLPRHLCLCHGATQATLLLARRPPSLAALHPCVQVVRLHRKNPGVSALFRGSGTRRAHFHWRRFRKKSRAVAKGQGFGLTLLQRMSGTARCPRRAGSDPATLPSSTPVHRGGAIRQAQLSGALFIFFFAVATFARRANANACFPLDRRALWPLTYQD
jgi:hypothetical protein